MPLCQCLGQKCLHFKDIEATTAKADWDPQTNDRYWGGYGGRRCTQSKTDTDDWDPQTNESYWGGEEGVRGRGGGCTQSKTEVQTDKNRQADSYTSKFKHTKKHCCPYYHIALYNLTQINTKQYYPC